MYFHRLAIPIEIEVNTIVLKCTDTLRYFTLNTRGRPAVQAFDAPSRLQGVAVFSSHLAWAFTDVPVGNQLLFKAPLCTGELSAVRLTEGYLSPNCLFQTPPPLRGTSPCYKGRLLHCAVSLAPLCTGELSAVRLTEGYLSPNRLFQTPPPLVTRGGFYTVRFLWLPCVQGSCQPLG